MQLEVGAILEGKVTGITKFGVFVDLPNGQTGMVHISEVASAFVKEIRDFVTEGQTVKVKVLSISDDGKISLSMKKAVPPQPRAPRERPTTRSAGRPGDYEWQSKPEPTSFEDMMSKFKQTSDEKMSALKKGMQSKRGGGYSRHGGTGSQR
ncbi:MAG: S1 RNA-binding domain-containing protein [Oscillospiraceae bacterium]|nr:S1 RNA-binding domain-containing protein [Oscillospiraceae bacterium]